VFAGCALIYPAGILTHQRIEHEGGLRHPHEVEQETGPEIQHAAPGVTNFAITCGGQ
jgi:hypothetical protein